MAHSSRRPSIRRREQDDGWPWSTRVRRRLFALQVLASAGVLLFMMVLTAWFTFEETLIGNAQVAGSTARTLATAPEVRRALADGHVPAEVSERLTGTESAEYYVFIAICDRNGVVHSTSGTPDSLRCPAELTHEAMLGLEEDAARRVSFTSVEGLLVRGMPVLGDSGEFLGTVVVGRDPGYVWGRVLPMLPAIALQYFVAGGLVTCIVMILATVFRRRLYALTPEEVESVVTERESLLSAMADGVIATDPLGRVTVFNDAAVSLTGLSADSVVGRALDPVDHPELVAAFAGDPGVERLILLGESVCLARVDTADPGAASTSPRHGRLLVLRDRSELTRVLEELDGAESTTEALRARNHEFANTLQVISGLITMRLFDDAQAFLEREGRGGDVLAGLADDRIESVGVVAFLQAARARAAELGISYVVDPESRLPGLDRSDRETRLGSDIVTIVGNLTRNALEACADGDTVGVLIRREPEVGHPASIRIVVSDDGPGVDGSIVDDVFTSGVSSRHRSGDALGRGIGLALVARIAQRYHGAASVRDRVIGGMAGGSIFEVVLRVPGPAPLGQLPDR